MYLGNQCIRDVRNDNVHRSHRLPFQYSFHTLHRPSYRHHHNWLLSLRDLSTHDGGRLDRQASFRGSREMCRCFHLAVHFLLCCILANSMVRRQRTSQQSAPAIHIRSRHSIELRRRLARNIHSSILHQPRETWLECKIWIHLVWDEYLARPAHHLLHSRNS